MPLSALRYLQATSSTLETGIENDYRSVDLSEEERAVLAEALKIIGRVEEEHYGTDPKTDFYEEQIEGTRLEERMRND